MVPRLWAALLPTLAFSAGLQFTPALAQPQAGAPASSAASAGRSDPADPKVPVPATSYVSPLRAYQAFAEPPVAPWRETNERVRERGGWRAYAREGGASDAAATPASGAHSGHPMK